MRMGAYTRPTHTVREQAAANTSQRFLKSPAS